MLKVLGFIVGCLLIVWGFNRFLPTDTQNAILNQTDQVIETSIQTAQDIAQQEHAALSPSPTEVEMDTIESRDPRADRSDISAEHQDTENAVNAITNSGVENKDDIEQQLSDALAPEILSSESESVIYLVTTVFADKSSARGLLNLLLKDKDMNHITFSIAQDANDNFGIAISASSQPLFELQHLTFMSKYSNINRENGPLAL